MEEHPNVSLVLKGLDFVSKRDAEGVMSIWAKDMTYYVVEDSGPPAEPMGREDFVGMMQTGSRMIPDRSYEVVHIQAAGSDLVAAHLRIRGTSARTGESVSGDYVGVFRITAGVISAGWEFTSHETQQFLDDSWG